MRGLKRAYAELANYFDTRALDKSESIGIAHADNAEGAEALLALLRDRVSPAGAAWIGLLVAGVIVVAANLGLGPDMIEPQRPGFGRYLPYLFWIVGPSLLVLGGLPWVGWALRTELDLKLWRPRR